MPKGAPCQREKGEGNNPGEGADEGGPCHRDRLDEPSLNVEPQAGRENRRYCNEEEGSSVSPLLRLKVAGPVADAPGDRSESMGEGQPQEAHSAADGAQESDEQARVGRATRPRCPLRGLAGSGLASRGPGCGGRARRRSGCRRSCRGLLRGGSGRRGLLRSSLLHGSLARAGRPGRGGLCGRAT